MLVKVVKSSHSVFQRVFLKENNLRFIRIDDRSFKVEQFRSFCNESLWFLIGEVFTKKATWVLFRIVAPIDLRPGILAVLVLMLLVVI